MWDMEEEIIGNRWKELDYDGEVTAVAMISSSPRSLTLPSLRHVRSSFIHHVRRVDETKVKRNERDER